MNSNNNILFFLIVFPVFLFRFLVKTTISAFNERCLNEHCLNCLNEINNLQHDRMNECRRKKKDLLIEMKLRERGKRKNLRDRQIEGKLILPTESCRVTFNVGFASRAERRSLASALKRNTTGMLTYKKQKTISKTKHLTSKNSSKNDN
jgi:hypothetical protein